MSRFISKQAGEDVVSTESAVLAFIITVTIYAAFVALMVREVNRANIRAREMARIQGPKLPEGYLNKWDGLNKKLKTLIQTMRSTNSINNTTVSMNCSIFDGHTQPADIITYIRNMHKDLKVVASAMRGPYRSLAADGSETEYADSLRKALGGRPLAIGGMLVHYSGNRPLMASYAPLTTDIQDIVVPTVNDAESNFATLITETGHLLTLLGDLEDMPTLNEHYLVTIWAEVAAKLVTDTLEGIIEYISKSIQ